MHKRGRRNGRTTARFAVFTLLVMALLWPATSAHAQLRQEQVEQKIDQLIEQIYDARNDYGIWDDRERGDDHVTGINWGGTTALMTFALITAGESYQDPRLEPAIEFLQNAEMTGTYAIAIRAHVWAALPDQFERYLRRDVQWLISAVGESGYDYTNEPRGSRVDNSVTQYGVLGVWEGAKRGLPVPDEYWQHIQEHFVKYQQGNGGWAYDASGGVRGSMTAAGVAALYITQDYLHREDFEEVGRTPEHPVQRRIDRGLEWFANNFRSNTNPGHGGYVQYYLYGVERIGLASGVRYFAGEDWYASGAEHLFSNAGDGTDAAFSLMFLVRGGVPVFANKLQIEGHLWNSRPRDLAHVTAWASDETERNMMWQVVPLDSEVETWLEAPMLYLAGHGELELNEEQEQKIKRYIDLGGTLITTADDSDSEFTNSVQELLSRLYPDYTLESFEEDDPLLDMIFELDPSVGNLQPQSVHNGVRHLAIHIPNDVSWTLHRDDRSQSDAWQFFTNIYFYATERGRNRDRLETHFTHKSRSGGGPEVTIGRATYDGNHDPEPLAWEVLSTFLHNEGKASVNVEQVALDSLPSPDEMPFVHVAGTAAHEFTEDELQSIKQYAEAGGLVLLENVGGRGDFADAAGKAMRELFSERLRPISSQSTLITGEGVGGYDMSTVRYRPYTVLRMGQVTAPRLLAMTIDDEVRVIVSGEDLTMAMLDQPVWGVFGYHPESAHRLVGNMVLRTLGPAEQEGEGEEG